MLSNQKWIKAETAGMGQPVKRKEKIHMHFSQRTITLKDRKQKECWELSGVIGVKLKKREVTPAGDLLPSACFKM